MEELEEESFEIPKENLLLPLLAITRVEFQWGSLVVSNAISGGIPGGTTTVSARVSASMFARWNSYRKGAASICNYVRYFSTVEVPLTAEYYNVKRGNFSSVSHNN